MQIIMISAKIPFGGLNPQMTNPRLKLEVLARVPSPQRKFPAVRMKSYSQGTAKSVRHRIFIPFSTVSSGIPSLNQSTTNCKDISVSTDVAKEREIKVRVDLSGARTQEIFDDVFSRLVDAAQPIPGFRRVKGGKTSDIPKDVLLQIIGPSKVKKEAILKVINIAVTEYVSKVLTSDDGSDDNHGGRWQRRAAGGRQAAGNDGHITLHRPGEFQIYQK